MQARTRLRHTARWGVTHAVIKVLNRREAKKGSDFARLMVDDALLADPYPTYEKLRGAGRLSGSGLIRVTATHAVASEVLRSEDFGVAAAAELPTPLRKIIEASRGEYDIGPVDPPSLLALDAPDHTRLRRLVARGFTARRVAAMEAGVSARTHALLNALEGRDEVDLVDEFAAQLPVEVIADLLGVPEDQRGELLGWGNEAARQLDSGLGLREFLHTTAAITGLHHWVDEHLARLRVQPGDDLLSGMLRNLEDLPSADRPNPVELRMVALLVLGAGFETTVNLIGNAVALLDAHPDQRDRCLADPGLWLSAVEEVLRFDPPVQFTARIARSPFTLAGESLRPGHTVLVLVGGANRDPEVFTDPAGFDISRPNAGDHVSFSMGAHYCIGAQLARLEAAVALRELYARFPRLRVTGPGVRRTTRVLRGYEHLPVNLDG